MKDLNSNSTGLSSINSSTRLRAFFYLNPISFESIPHQLKLKSERTSYSQTPHAYNFSRKNNPAAMNSVWQQLGNLTLMIVLSLILLGCEEENIYLVLESYALSDFMNTAVENIVDDEIIPNLEQLGRGKNGPSTYRIRPNRHSTRSDTTVTIDYQHGRPNEVTFESRRLPGRDFPTPDKETIATAANGRRISTRVTSKLVVCRVCDG